MCSTQAAATRLPVPTEPVKVMALTSGLSRIVWPTTEPLPITRLSTPLGRPARCRMSTIAHEQPGTRSAGLNTIVLPWQSAGAIFQAGMAIGKFHGVMMPTTPTASRVISTPTPGRTLGTVSPVSRSASPAKKSKICAARTVSPMPSASVLPSSRDSSLPSSSLRAVISSEALRSTAWRSSSPERDHFGNAALAAAIAASRIRLGGARVVADHVVGVGRIDVGNGFAADPLAADQVPVQLTHVTIHFN